MLRRLNNRKTRNKNKTESGLVLRARTMQAMFLVKKEEKCSERYRVRPRFAGRARGFVWSCLAPERATDGRGVSFALAFSCGCGVHGLAMVVGMLGMKIIGGCVKQTGGRY